MLYENINQTLSKKIRKSFTLAEIMIVLVVLGIIAAILLPNAVNSVPDKNLMKFKKANTDLLNTISELVSSDKYYSNGLLTNKTDGTFVEDSSYFCETFSQVIGAKNKNCGGTYFSANRDSGIANPNWSTDGSFDENCILYSNVGEEIVTNDGVIFYETAPGQPFGTNDVYSGADEWEQNEEVNKQAELLYQKIIDNYNANKSLDEEDLAKMREYVETRPYTQHTGRLFLIQNSDYQYVTYKIICMDVDGIGKGEWPFGYGIRADGKIWLGARAKEWLDKDIQKKN